MITLNTYADALGDWQAEVTMTGVGDEALAAKLAEIAVRAELEARGNGQPIVFTLELHHRDSRGGELAYYFSEVDNPRE